jgi:hypothetical protein
VNHTFNTGGPKANKYKLKSFRSSSGQCGPAVLKNGIQLLMKKRGFQLPPPPAPPASSFEKLLKARAKKLRGLLPGDQMDRAEPMLSAAEMAFICDKFGCGFVLYDFAKLADQQEVELELCVLYQGESFQAGPSVEAVLRGDHFLLMVQGGQFTENRCPQCGKSKGVMHRCPRNSDQCTSDFRNVT